jgi:hypothetical protein
MLFLTSRGIVINIYSSGFYVFPITDITYFIFGKASLGSASGSATLIGMLSILASIMTSFINGNFQILQSKAVINNFGWVRP